MSDEQSVDLVEAMRTAAAEAASAAAGAVIGARIAAAHPGLPRLVWGADDGWNAVRWHASAYVDTRSDAETRAIVTAYADALGGSDPREVDMGKYGSRLVTAATFTGIQVTVCGILHPAEPKPPR